MPPTYEIAVHHNAHRHRSADIHACACIVYLHTVTGFIFEVICIAAWTRLDRARVQVPTLHHQACTLGIDSGTPKKYRIADRHVLSVAVHTVHRKVLYHVKDREEGGERQARVGYGSCHEYQPSQHHAQEHQADYVSRAQAGGISPYTAYWNRV